MYLYGGECRVYCNYYLIDFPTIIFVLAQHNYAVQMVAQIKYDLGNKILYLFWLTREVRGQSKRP